MRSPERPQRASEGMQGPEGKSGLLEWALGLLPPTLTSVSTLICCVSQGLLKISFGKRILLKLRDENHLHRDKIKPQCQSQDTWAWALPSPYLAACDFVQVTSVL